MQATLKAQILYLLKQRGLTQVQLARQMGLDERTLRSTLSSSLIRPNSHWPAILDALGVEIVLRPKSDPS